MSEPTVYDLVQDERIGVVEGLVTSSYTPFQGPEYSFPVVHQPVDDEMWQYITLGIGSGILDVGGRPYWMKKSDLSNANDTGKLTVSVTTKNAQAALRGFYHRLNQDMVLSFPAVSTKTTYHVVLEYDPANHKTEAGPIRVRVLTSLDWNGGKFYLPLWEVIREPNQLLSDATLVQRRPKISYNLNVDEPENLPDARTFMWGSTCTIRYGYMTGARYVASGESEEKGGPTDWVLLNSGGWKDIGMRSEYTSGWGNTVQYRVEAGYVELKGIVERKDKADLARNAVTQFGWIPGLDMSPFRSFPVACGGAGRCRIDTTQGKPTYNDFAYYTPDSTKWFCLDGIKFRVNGWVS